MSRPTAAHLLRERDELLAGASRAQDTLGLFAEASARLRRLVPFSAAVWRATDPLTGLMTAPIRVENLDEDGCAVFWDSELLSESVNPFHAVARMPVPAAGLRESTGDLPGRSALYRQYMRPRGLDDELRTVLRAGGLPWGTVSLFRERGQMPFTPADIEFLAGLSGPLGHRLRSYARPPAVAGPGAVPGPGLLLFDQDGVLVSVNDEARHHLARIPEGPAVDGGFGLSLPAWVHSTVVRARAIAEGRDRGCARVRVRSRSGAWLQCHASCLTGADGSIGQTVLVLDVASASEIAPILFAAYELSERELEITQLLARGMATGEIAGKLFLSPHTIRDHIKTIFDKVRVSSRGELVAKLFTEHYEPFGAGQVVRVSDH
ncbi:helix-turn-helix domain-containing protein [Amycolatopsis nigrescens]|uniref:helix-turn-helix domain-containing protein n=1 Tax=Amycolatopsis nigrescens TaxID=381445 RepID=UPI00037EEF00|nr:helix-turn-helix transcriptional regulator [Amycolatopsis nigrescens]